MPKLEDRILEILKTVYQDHDNYLRDQLVAHEELTDLITELSDFVQQTNKDDFRLCSLLGNSYRVLNQPVDALAYLGTALKVAREERHNKRIIVTLIRIGEALKYNNEHDKALELFEEAISLINLNGVDEYRDFAFQHKGKCLMELHKWAEARKMLKKALYIRKEKGNLELIESTSKALNYIESSIEADGILYVNNISNE